MKTLITLWQRKLQTGRKKWIKQRQKTVFERTYSSLPLSLPAAEFVSCRSRGGAGGAVGRHDHDQLPPLSLLRNAPDSCWRASFAHTALHPMFPSVLSCAIILFLSALSKWSLLLFNVHDPERGIQTQEQIISRWTESSPGTNGSPFLCCFN